MAETTEADDRLRRQQVNVRLDTDLYRALRAYAALHGTTFQSLAEEAIAALALQRGIAVPGLSSGKRADNENGASAHDARRGAAESGNTFPQGGPDGLRNRARETLKPA